MKLEETIGLMGSLKESNHFTLENLADGVFACLHKPGGAAYSNAGIIDLGDRTVVVDAFDTMAAGRHLRQTAENLFGRPVDTLVLTHPHSDHWVGASVFDPSTTMIATQKTREVCEEWGKDMMEDFQHPEEWDAWVNEMVEQLKTERDENKRISLESSILRARHTMAEMAQFQPRYADQTFEDEVILKGSKRTAKLRSFGRGHSEDDAVLILPEDQIAFIGDIGFFDTQPFLGFCEFENYREQLEFFQASDFEIIVPGHGLVAYSKEYLNLQLQYMDLMADLVREVVQGGGTFEQAKQITLPAPFDRWLMGGMGRFETNIRYLFTRFGGQVPDE